MSPPEQQNRTVRAAQLDEPTRSELEAFSETANAYGQASAAAVYAVHADPGPVAVLSQAHAALAKLLAAGDEDLLPTADILRYAKYRLATNILPPLHTQLGLQPLADDLDSHLDQMHPGTPGHNYTAAAIDALRDILSRDTLNLAEETERALSLAQPGERLLVLPHGTNAAATSQFLESRGLPTQVIGKSELRRHSDYDMVVCVGPYQFFPSATWSAARADSVCFVLYPFGRSTTPPSGGLFGPDGGLATPKFRSSGISMPTEGVDFSDIDENFIAAADRVVAQRRGTGAETAEAQLLLLEGGYAVWSAVSDASWMWTIDVSEPGSPIITQVSDANVAAGSYIFFRDEGAAGDLVEVVADSMFGATEHRGSQRGWKSHFRQAIDRVGGFTEADRALRRKGANTANSRGWADSRSIRPNSKQDFQVACKFAHIEDQADAIWSSLTAIRSAHQKAGLSIRKQLEVALVADGCERLISDGYRRLEVDGLGGMSAYRVLLKHPDLHRVDTDLIDKPFLEEERGWQG